MSLATVVASYYGNVWNSYLFFNAQASILTGTCLARHRRRLGLRYRVQTGSFIYLDKQSLHRCDLCPKVKVFSITLLWLLLYICW